MSERNPFDHKPGSGLGQLRCEEWEELLADALDGLLPAKEHAAFDMHGAQCKVCAQLLSHAKQGQEWLKFLEEEPETPLGMVERILGKTSGSAVTSPLALSGHPATPVPAHVLGLPVMRGAWDSRMMMTVAMAFFSIALTLNLMGIRVTHLRLSDLTPASMEMNLTHQFYTAKSSLVRYYSNLRLVYEVESKVHELRRTEEMQQPMQQEVPQNPQGNGHKNGGKLMPQTNLPQQEGRLWGTPEMASNEGVQKAFQEQEQDIRKTEMQEEGNFEVFCDGNQAERSLV